MSVPRQADTARKDIVRLAHAELDSAALRRAVAARLRRVVPAEAYGFATVDPATMLLTGSVRENIPDATVALLAANEYGQDDYIKFADLARGAVPVGRLSAATTRGELTRSRRYRDIFIPAAGVTSCGPCSPPAMQAGDSSACTANGAARISPPPRPASWPASPGMWPPDCARPCSSGPPPPATQDQAPASSRSPTR